MKGHQDDGLDRTLRKSGQFEETPSAAEEVGKYLTYEVQVDWVRQQNIKSSS